MRLDRDCVSVRSVFETREKAPVAASFMMRCVRLCADGLISLPVALAAALYSVSFAVIVYGGPLSSHLDAGIGLALLGSGLAAVATGLTGSLRGAVTHAQDATALVTASAVSSLVAGMAVTTSADARFATTVIFIAAATCLTGLFIYIAGRFRMSYLARFMPYPVISGLIVSIGYLLCLGSIELATGHPVDAMSLPVAVLRDDFLLWVPCALWACGMLFLGRWMPQSRVLSVGILSGLVVFYGVCAATGLSLSEVQAAGLLLGPFPDNGLRTVLSGDILSAVDWVGVAGNLSVVLALVPLAVVSGILNLQGISVATGQDHDLDRDVKAIGLSNMVSGTAGGLVCYPAMSTSILGTRLDVRPAAPWVVSGFVCLAFAFAGPSVLGLLPRSLFAMVVFFLGFSLLLQTLLNDFRRLPPRDVASVLAILLTTVVAGMFPALLVGVGLSTLTFIVSYARLPFLRTDTTLALRRSIIERAEPNHAILTRLGGQVRILELTGALFFGTAYALRQHIKAATDVETSATRTIVVDFRDVRDVDASAIFSFERTLIDCARKGIVVCLSGLRPDISDRFRRFALFRTLKSVAEPRVFDTLDAALQCLENEILSEQRALGAAETEPSTFLRELQLAVPDIDLFEVFPVLTVPDGETFVAQGAASREIFILLEGGAVATVDAPDLEPCVIAKFEPGALIGEMAFYTHAGRTATVTADGVSRLMRVDLSTASRGGAVPDALASAFHLIAARHLAQRLAVSTRLLRRAIG